MTQTTIATPPHHGFFSRLYSGTGALDVIGRRKFYYALTGAIVLVCLLSIIFRGFALGIDFEGGSKFEFPARGGITISQVEHAYAEAMGKDPVSVQSVGTGSAERIQIRSDSLTQAESDKVTAALIADTKPTNPADALTAKDISTSDVSETWGTQITHKALIALIVFLVIVTIYIAVRFERGMAASAIAALFFDMSVTAGVYSIVGFEVTPATVIGLLTILGFSLYDSVVVFDKVEENTRGIVHQSKRTYAEQANLAVNQTLMRSINTTLIGVLPVLGLMVVAVWMLGVGTLKDLALVQLVGMIVGAYSSIFFATPLLVSIKERWGPIAAHTKKVQAKREARAIKAEDGATMEDTVGVDAGIDLGKHRSAGSKPAPGARPAGKRTRRAR